MTDDPRDAAEASAVPSTWKPSGVVTLLTDFGQADPWVGMMKGVLHARFPDVRTIDLSHGVPAQDVPTAAWILAHSWRYFPAGTVHLAVVDPGVGSDRAILVAERDGHAFLAPDNGLLGPTLEGGGSARALDVERFALPAASRTFHGRDVFAPAGAALAAGLAPRAAGTLTDPAPPIRFPAPEPIPAGGFELEVLIVDRFGNLITNFAADVLGNEEWDPAVWIVEIAGRRVRARETYADARPGELLALVDSYGCLEIAVRDGDASTTLGLGRGAGMTLRRLGT